MPIPFEVAKNSLSIKVPGRRFVCSVLHKVTCLIYSPPPESHSVIVVLSVTGLTGPAGSQVNYPFINLDFLHLAPHLFAA